MAKKENDLGLPPLYQPSIAGELLTPSSISKLMLGFTAGLDFMAIAMEEVSGKRYDLWGQPEKYWCEFCKRLRRNLNKEQLCVDWDKKVAQILLGKMEEDYPGQGKEFRDVFQCHAGMLDLAEVIQVAGQPLAVLHGGQLTPKDDPAWIRSVSEKLLKPPLNLLQSEIDDLIFCALEESDSLVTEKQLADRDELFRKFARELEDLFNKLYNEHRLASEEALLHAVASRIYLQETPTWDALWDALKNLFIELCTATGLCQIEWFMGSEHDRFRLRSTTGASKDWKEKTLSIGPFWEELSRYSGWTKEKRWDFQIRKSLSLPDNYLCAVYPIICSFGTPERNIPAMLVVSSLIKESEALSRFLSRLAKEIQRGIVAAIGEIEKKRVMEEMSTRAAYVGHDMKLPLQVMVNVIPTIRLYLNRSGIADLKLNSLVENLTNAVKSAQDKATELENMPVREFVVEPRLKRHDLLGMVNEIIDLVNRLGIKRGISLHWIYHPDNPVYCELDYRYMEVALHAVFDNAFKYSFAGNEVRVRLDIASDQTAELRISNLGVGIPPDRKFTIFEFGQRGEVQDDYIQRTGVGLGLPFAKRIIEAHKGNLEIKSHSSLTPPPEKDDYLSHIVEVIIRLPLARSN